MQIAIISDTHLPRGSRRLPSDCVARLRAAELIIHAGDLITTAVLRELQTFGDLAAVHGNVDDAELRHALPAARVVQAAGVRLAVIHDAGPSAGRLQRLRAQFAQVDAVIFGHSHLPLHEIAPDGFQIFNPGSPTERRRAPAHTMGMAQAESGEVSFTHVALTH